MRFIIHAAVPLLLILISSNALVSKETISEEMLRQAQKEARNITKDHRDFFSENSTELGFEIEDLLPEQEKGQQFCPEEAEQQFKNRKSLANDSNLSKFLKGSQKAENIEAEEEFMFLSSDLASAPENGLEIVEIENKTIKEEIKLESCLEEGSYKAVIEQRREVEILPEIKSHIKNCKGHSAHKKFFWKSDAEQKAKKIKHSLSKDDSLLYYSVYIPKGGTTKDYVVVWEYKHKDNVIQCDDYDIREIIEQKSQENDSWKVDNPSYLESLQNDPNCSLLYVQILEGPETKIINSESVFRDKWSQQLIFSCSPRGETKCEKLRKLGGILVNKKCLKHNQEEECIQWEKTYDLGKKAEISKTTLSFKESPILGLNGGFDTTYDKNEDFGNTVSTLSVFSDLKESMELSGEDFDENLAEIFRGERLKCKKSTAPNALYDCCKKLDGLAVKAALANCSSEEKCLSQYRNDGRCHYVGKDSAKLGLETIHYFCCFPTKLARLVQEEGRKQLNIDWGDSSRAKCRGLTLQEFQKIDFSLIDFSEIADDYRVDKEKLMNKIRSTISEFEISNPEHFQQTTNNTLKRQYEELQQN